MVLNIMPNVLLQYVTIIDRFPIFIFFPVFTKYQASTLFFVLIKSIKKPFFFIECIINQLLNYFLYDLVYDNFCVVLCFALPCLPREKKINFKVLPTIKFLKLQANQIIEYKETDSDENFSFIGI